jgi:hypothetical protein
VFDIASDDKTVQLNKWNPMFGQGVSMNGRWTIHSDGDLSPLRKEAGERNNLVRILGELSPQKKGNKGREGLNRPKQNNQPGPGIIL